MCNPTTFLIEVVGATNFLFTMKLYLVIVLVLCGSYADDELPEDIADLLSQFSDDFNHQLQKRLTDLDPDLNLLDQAQKVDKGKLVNDKGSSCFYEVSEQRIIRTHDSLNNGATYIDSPTEIQNQTACRAECCTHSECDLAVFKDKVRIFVLQYRNQGVHSITCRLF